MSWAGGDWTVGLSGLVLQKVQQLQAQNEKLNKERQQRQLQLDNSEAALHKQKKKYEEVRGDLAALQREMADVRDAAQVEVRARERLAHELQVKTGQFHSLEGQLESAKNHIQTLTQEIKRLEAELEKLQKGNGSGDSMLFSTPCWNMSSPWDHNGGFRVENESKAQNVRQQLQFGDSPKPSVGGASSPFPQQPLKSPPTRRTVRQSKASTPSSVFPWERDDLRSTPKGRPASSVSSNDVIIKNNASGDCGMEEALKKDRDELRVRVAELQRKVQVESECLKDTESRLAQAQREISSKEQNLTHTQEQLTRAQTRITQESDRAQAAEQRVKQLQEELKCQRQNAETSRCNAEQRRKDTEREHQRELVELQRERQALEKQHQQENNRLNQEIQQARTLHNTLQAQYDKVCLQKQGLERDLEDVRGKLKNAEADLRESQKRETQTEAKLTEAVRERESLTVSLAQMKKQEKTLQEEVKRLTEELAEALKLIKELQAQLAAPPPVLAPHPFSSAENSFSPSVPIHLDRSPPHHHSSQKKRPVKTGRIREEERMKYPSGREPGEGIDSEHIESFGSEESQKIQTKGIQALQSGSLRLSETDGDVSVTEQDTGIDDMDTDSFTSDSTSSTRHKSESDFSSNLQTDIKSEAGSVEKHDSSLKDLKKENAELRDELREIKYDLQKRLEDLETQRRAETEARTKLKQLSRKHSTQTEQHRAKALELKDSVTKLETQLEQEKKENTKLRETLAVLEREADERQEERETEEEEGSRLKEVLAEMEHKEKCTEEEMRVMKKKLEDLNFTLAQERQEREREREEEKKKIRREELEGLKIAQLQEELDNLRKSGSLEEKILKENNPVTYLQLERHPDTDYNAALKENNGFAPSPDMQVSICESVNLQNTLICDKSRTVELIMDFREQTKPSEQPSLNSKLKGSTAESGGTPALSTDAAELDENTVLVLEVERLRRARDQEAEKAELNQRKLDDLQKQVNKQTMQLTQAFESQSKHIENLLGELHDKDCALQRQGEELQNCQDKIALLEAEQHTREDTDLSKASPQLKPFTEISRDISCDSVISNTSISDHELFSDEMLVGSKEVSQPTVHLPTAHSDSQNNKEINTSDISDKLQRCEVVTEVSKQDEIFPTSDVCHENASSSSLNPQTQRLSEMTDKVTEVENSTVRSSLQTEQSEILKFQQNISEEATDDISELQRVRKELQKARDQLNVLQAQNEELALQGGVAKDEMLSVKRENEELKLKLKHVGKETDSIPEQDGLLPLANTENKDFSVTNEEEMQDSAPLGQEEPVAPDEKFKDGEMKNIKCEDERSSKAEVHSLQEQIQALQTQVQDLSEQNRTQAEELQLWKISAMSPEETVGNNSPFILLREDELLFSCSPNKLHTQAIMTRTMMHQCSVTDMTQQCGLEDRDDHASFKEHESAETQMTNNLRESQGPSEGLMTGNEKVVTKETVREECETITVNHSKESPSVCVSDVKISDTKDRLSVLQTNPTDYCNSEIRQIASVCPEYKTKEVAARLNSQESINVSILTEYQTKVINSEPITGPLETEDSTNPDRFVSGHNVDETMETAALDQHCHCHGDTTDTHNKYHTTVQRQSDGSEPVRNDSAAQGQRAEVSEVTVDPNRAEVRDVRSVSTQTEESNESRDVDLETSSSQTQKLPVLHASTQTDEVQLKTEEDEDYNEPADSPPLSPAPQCVMDKLLISKVFPMSDPAHIAERIRQNRNRMSAAYDDTEYEPYGLPEVVMKGFADIPSGPACPYVLRRGLLGTDALPLPLRETTPQDENEEIEP